MFRGQATTVSQMSLYTQRVYGLLQGALASSTAATGTVDNLSPRDASVGTTATSLAVANRLGWTGLDNAKAYVARYMDLGTWDLINLECS